MRGSQALDGRATHGGSVTRHMAASAHRRRRLEYDPPTVPAHPPCWCRNQRAPQVGTEAEAVVEGIRAGEYLILSLPGHAGLVGFAAITDFNQARTQHVRRQFSLGQRVMTTVQVGARAGEGGEGGHRALLACRMVLWVAPMQCVNSKGAAPVAASPAPCNEWCSAPAPAAASFRCPFRCPPLTGLAGACCAMCRCPSRTACRQSPGRGKPMEASGERIACIYMPLCPPGLVAPSQSTYLCLDA